VYFGVTILAGLALAYLVIQLARPEWRFGLWVAVILAVVVPWSAWQDHSHWEGVNWIPFSAEIADVKLRDAVANLALYIPFGYLLVTHHARGWAAVWIAGLGALILSLGTEYAQVYSHGRYPSMTDVVMNGLGGVVGALLAKRAQTGRRRR
jgi:glycopeptide antibiotics resistance protein